MTTTTDNTPATDLEAAIGGKHIPVTFKDKARPTEQLFIKELGIKQADAALLTFQDEIGRATLFTGKDADWLDTLSIGSFNSVIEEGNKVNADFFDYCEKRAARRTEAQERVMPGFKERMMGAAEKELSSLVAKHSASFVQGSPS